MKRIYILCFVLLYCAITQAQITQVTGPSGSVSFGTSIVVLTNGNYVVTDPYWNNGTSEVGAVYLYNGATHALISTLTGSTANDQVGSRGVVALSNGNYVISSPNWDNASVSNAGAVTWGNGITGVSGVVSTSNSLVGSKANDQVGASGVITLNNDNYVVSSPNWDNASVSNAGAVTWGSGLAGIIGVVSISNSLVGSTANDYVGSGGVIALSNGNYVVKTQSWDNVSVANVGAVTWGSGTEGVNGVVSVSNSLVGSTANDQVGSSGFVELSNGNYVVISTSWDNASASDAGAVTWGNGKTGVSGVVSASNSLVGSAGSDKVGIYGVIALSNGHYVVRSSLWDNGLVNSAGAVTWGNGTTGVSGAVSASNSLVGSTADDQVGNSGVFALKNGNYVVASPDWDRDLTNNAGAVTWGDGTTGVSGVVSISNSLVGSAAGDAVGNGGVAALSNGNYVVSSASWNNDLINAAGAVTWGSGTTGLTGVVSASNSLVGSTANDAVGNGGVVALSNGNYVVVSNTWNNGSATRGRSSDLGQWDRWNNRCGECYQLTCWIYDRRPCRIRWCYCSW